jgi:HAD superfamily hydrolase (TIGR01490 family)
MLMPEEKLTLAIFDFDGTLTDGHLWKGIQKHHNQKKVKRWSLFLYVWSHLPFWLAAKMKLYSEEKNRYLWGRDLSSLLKGFTPEEARELYQWLADNYFKDKMKPELLKMLAEHKQKGDTVILLSGMFVEFLDMMGKNIGVDYVQGTKLEMKNNRYTGKIIDPLCFGQNKAVFLKRLIEEKGFKVDYDKSAAYADSFYDMPVFDLVGKRVAAYPDKKLFEFATAKGWQIIGRREESLKHP